MYIKTYTNKTEIPDSKFQEYAVYSKLSDTHIIKHMRFVDPVVDDDGNLFPFVRRDHIIFISGLAISIRSLLTFLNTIELENAYTGQPLTLFLSEIKENGLDPLISYLKSINVLTIHNISSVEIELYSAKEESKWVDFCLSLNKAVTKKNVKYENEVKDF